MNLEEMKSRLGEIKNKLGEFAAIETPSQEDIDGINALTTEATDLKSKIEAKEKMDSVLASLGNSERKTTPVVNREVVVGSERKLENGNFGFQNRGDYYQAVKNFATGNASDEMLKIRKYQAAQGLREKVGEDGGFAVPADQISGIQKALESDMSLLSRCTSLNVSGNRADLLVDENSPYVGNGQNFRANWVGEGKQIDKSKAKLKEVTIKAEKLAALIPVTEELLEDSALAESWIETQTPEVFTAAVNNAIISGDGIKKPTGILNSDFGFEVAKESGQAADTVIFDNIKKLHTHALPMAKQRGIYLYNPAVEEQLIGMQLDPSSTDSVSVYLPNNSVDGAPFGTLWGKPIMPMMGALKALGDKGDIMFVDLSYYYAILKVGGLKRSISTEFYFDTDETAFKYTFRMGGLCPFSAPQSTEFGNYLMSGFTYLQDRA